MKTTIKTIYDFIINSDIEKNMETETIICHIVFKVNDDDFVNKIAILGTFGAFDNINDENELNKFFFESFFDLTKTPEFKQMHNFFKDNKDTWLDEDEKNKSI